MIDERKCVTENIFDLVNCSKNISICYIEDWCYNIKTTNRHLDINVIVSAVLAESSEVNVFANEMWRCALKSH